MAKFNGESWFNQIYINFNYAYNITILSKIRISEKGSRYFKYQYTIDSLNVIINLLSLTWKNKTVVIK